MGKKFNAPPGMSAVSSAHILLHQVGYPSFDCRHRLLLHWNRQKKTPIATQDQVSRLPHNKYHYMRELIAVMRHILVIGSSRHIYTILSRTMWYSTA